tara:strand:+ start:25 stop:540 length:516 start_codon:yes stop_codon:yes gene_type:complete
MRSFSKLLIFIFFSFNILNISYASDLYFINIEKVIYLSNPGKLIISNLEEIEKLNSSNFEEKKNKISIKENNISKNKENLSDQEFKDQVEDLKKEISIYNRERNEKLKNFNKLKKQKVDSLMKKFVPIIENYMKQNNISFIIDKKNIFIANKKYDITDKIINLINEKFKND